MDDTPLMADFRDQGGPYGSVEPTQDDRDYVRRKSRLLILTILLFTCYPVILMVSALMKFTVWSLLYGILCIYSLTFPAYTLSGPIDAVRGPNSNAVLVAVPSLPVSVGGLLAGLSGSILFGFSCLHGDALHIKDFCASNAGLCSDLLLTPEGWLDAVPHFMVTLASATVFHIRCSRRAIRGKHVEHHELVPLTMLCVLGFILAALTRPTIAVVPLLALSVIIITIHGLQLEGSCRCLLRLCFTLCRIISGVLLMLYMAWNLAIVQESLSRYESLAWLNDSIYIRFWGHHTKHMKEEFWPYVGHLCALAVPFLVRCIEMLFLATYRRGALGIASASTDGVREGMLTPNRFCVWGYRHSPQLLIFMFAVISCINLSQWNIIWILMFCVGFFIPLNWYPRILPLLVIYSWIELGFQFKSSMDYPPDLAREIMSERDNTCIGVVRNDTVRMVECSDNSTLKFMNGQMNLDDDDTSCMIWDNVTLTMGDCSIHRWDWNGFNHYLIKSKDDDDATNECLQVTQHGHLTVHQCPQTGNEESPSFQFQIIDAIIVQWRFMTGRLLAQTLLGVFISISYRLTKQNSDAHRFSSPDDQTSQEGTPTPVSPLESSKATVFTVSPVAQQVVDDSTSWLKKTWIRMLTFGLNHVHKVTLTMMFIIGLVGRPSVLKGTFLIFFLTYFTNPEMARRTWLALVAYTSFALISVYIFTVFPEIPSPTIIGLKLENDHSMELILYILLYLCAVVQFHLYQSNLISSRVRQKSGEVKLAIMYNTCRFFAICFLLFISFRIGDRLRDGKHHGPTVISLIFFLIFLVVVSMIILGVSHRVNVVVWSLISVLTIIMSAAVYCYQFDETRELINDWLDKKGGKTVTPEVIGLEYFQSRGALFELLPWAMAVVCSMACAGYAAEAWDMQVKGVTRRPDSASQQIRSRCSSHASVSYETLAESWIVILRIARRLLARHSPKLTLFALFFANIGSFSYLRTEADEESFDLRANLLSTLYIVFMVSCNAFPNTFVLSFAITLYSMTVMLSMYLFQFANEHLLGTLMWDPILAWIGLVKLKPEDGSLTQWEAPHLLVFGFALLQTRTVKWAKELQNENGVVQLHIVSEFALEEPDTHRTDSFSHSFGTRRARANFLARGAYQIKKAVVNAVEYMLEGLWTDYSAEIIGTVFLIYIVYQKDTVWAPLYMAYLGTCALASNGTHLKLYAPRITLFVLSCIVVFQASMYLGIPKIESTDTAGLKVLYPYSEIEYKTTGMLDWYVRTFDNNGEDGFLYPCLVTNFLLAVLVGSYATPKAGPRKETVTDILKNTQAIYKARMSASMKPLLDLLPDLRVDSDDPEEILQSNRNYMRQSYSYGQFKNFLRYYLMPYILVVALFLQSASDGDLWSLMALTASLWLIHTQHTLPWRGNNYWKRVVLLLYILWFIRLLMRIPYVLLGCGEVDSIPSTCSFREISPKNWKLYVEDFLGFGQLSKSASTAFFLGAFYLQTYSYDNDTYAWVIIHHYIVDTTAAQLTAMNTKKLEELEEAEKAKCQKESDDRKARLEYIRQLRHEKELGLSTGLPRASATSLGPRSAVDSGSDEAATISPVDESLMVPEGQTTSISSKESEQKSPSPDVEKKNSGEDDVEDAEMGTPLITSHGPTTPGSVTSSIQEEDQESQMVKQMDVWYNAYLVPIVQSMITWLRTNSVIVTDHRDISEIVDPNESRSRWVQLAYSTYTFLCSYTDWVCYTMFILNWTFYPNFFSLLPVLTLFTYALLVDQPTMTYWNMMQGYCEALVVLNALLPKFPQLSEWSNSVLGFSLGQKDDERRHQQEFNRLVLMMFTVFVLIIHRSYYCYRPKTNRSGSETLPTTESDSEHRRHSEALVSRGDKTSVWTRMTSLLPSITTFKAFGITMFNVYKDILTAPRLGKDFYGQSFLFQLTGLIWFIFGYRGIVGSDSSSDDFVESIQKNLLPGALAVCMLIYFNMMVADRICRLLASTVLKLVLHIFAFVAVVTFSWQYFITKRVQGGALGSSEGGPGGSTATSRSTFAIEGLFILTCMWLASSCRQLYYGYPSTVDSGFLMSKWNMYKHYLYLGYRALPFVFEMKALLDWSFTGTTLKMNQWLKVEDIHHELMLTRNDTMVTKGYNRQYGKPFPFANKCYSGCLGFAVLTFFLFFPLLFYSSYNPGLSANTVLAASVTIEFPNANPIYEARRSNVSLIVPPAAEANASISIVDLIDQSNLLSMENYLTEKKNIQRISLGIEPGGISDGLWQISPPALKHLTDGIQKCLKNTTDDCTNQLKIKASITRARGLGGPTFEDEQSYHFKDIRPILNLLKTNENANISLDKFYNPILLNQPVEVVRAPLDDDKKVRCNLNKIKDGGNVYFGVKCLSLKDLRAPKDKQPSVPLYFVVISSEVPAATGFGLHATLASFSILTLYTTFVLTTGRVVRSSLTGSAQRVVLEDMRNPGPLIELVEDIKLARAEGLLYLEEDLYAELIEIYQSPALIKQWTNKPI